MTVRGISPLCSIVPFEKAWNALDIESVSKIRNDTL